MLPGPATVVRLTLHVLAAAVWVGGQFTVAGLLPTVRRLGDGASKAVAQAFARLQWPAYLVLIVTGVWNVTASDPSQQGSAWNTVLGVKITVALGAGLAAFLHQRARTKAGLAAFGGLGGVLSLAALVLGIVLAA